MSVDLSTADALDALGVKVSGLTGPDADADNELAGIIAEVMLQIDGRTLATGFKYTLNVTCALQLRPKHWYMELEEYNLNNPGTSATHPCFCGLLLVPNQATGFSYSAQGYGVTIGLATCAAICFAWAQIVRLYLSNNYNV